MILFSLCLWIGGAGPLHATDGPSHAWDDWYVGMYASRWVGGVGSTSMSGLFNLNNLKHSYLYTANVGKEIANPYESLFIDAEGQIGLHTGDQDHVEYVGALILRWEDFPWDEELDTSFSIGEGLSWASEIPKRENLTARGSAQLLNYVSFEVAVSPWEKKQWEGFFRVHHRSGIFGTFSDVYGASNFIGFGVRYRR